LRAEFVSAYTLLRPSSLAHHFREERAKPVLLAAHDLSVDPDLVIDAGSSIEGG
jgi:hypothetical protein